MQTSQVLNCLLLHLRWFQFLFLVIGKFVTWFSLCGLLDMFADGFRASGADLSDADLRGADFSLANLTKVKCSGSHITLVQFHQDSIQARLCTRLYSILFKMPDKYLILIQNVQPSLNQTFIFGPISFMLLSLFIFYETNPFMFSLSD